MRLHYRVRNLHYRVCIIGSVHSVLFCKPYRRHFLSYNADGEKSFCIIGSDVISGPIMQMEKGVCIIGSGPYNADGEKLLHYRVRHHFLPYNADEESLSLHIEICIIGSQIFKEL